jgi:phytoene synthase
VTADDYCRQKAAARGSSAHYAFVFLPSAQRRAVTALYAFCTEAAGIVAECSDAQLARTKLAWWRAEVAGLFDATPRHPVTTALQPHLAPFALAATQLLRIIDGAEMDLAQTRYADFAGLQRYLDYAAATPGAAAAGIYGYRNPRTVECAERLGIAGALTHLICAVGEDARRNRIYLPMDELQRFGVPAADILQARHTDRFRQLMLFQARRAQAHFDAALDTLPPEDRRAQRPGLILAAICRATLAELEREQFRVLTQRTALTPLRKFWLAWKTWSGA